MKSNDNIWPLESRLVVDAESRLLVLFEELLLDRAYTDTRVTQEEIAFVIARVALGGSFATS
jgi:hypothetical protein